MNKAQIEAALGGHNHVFKNGRCIACDLTEKQINAITAAAEVGNANRIIDESGARLYAIENENERLRADLALVTKERDSALHWLNRGPTTFPKENEAAIDLLVREKRAERVLIDGKPGVRLVKKLVGLSQLETEMMEEIKQLKSENRESKLQFELNATKAELQFADEQINRITADRAGVCATHVLRDKELIERCALWIEDNYPSARTIALEMRRALKDTL